MDSPYRNLPGERFWKTGVAGSGEAAPQGLYRKKWDISKETKIATAGSCFAQHVGRRLKAEGFNVLDYELAPNGLSDKERPRFGYSIYSARYGNIYTSRQLLQLAQEALGAARPSDVIWRRGDRVYDALRPSVEPAGLQTEAELLAHRAFHLSRIRTLLRDVELFVFTLGLTECWIHKASGTVYPTAPGTIAGSFDADTYAFKNLTFAEIREDFLEFRKLVHNLQGHDRVRFLLTVSPVPLTATASEKHVLQATVYSKSVLRAVAGELEATFADVDYFPSFEIITSPWKGVNFFESNQREVTKEGVACAMNTFVGAHTRPEAFVERPRTEPASVHRDDTEAVCEDILLEQFARSV